MNSKNRNIYHYFAKYTAKSNLEPDYIELLYEEITRRKISFVAKDNQGRNALHLASAYNFIYLIKKLLENDAKIDELDNSKRSALHLAVIH